MTSSGAPTLTTRSNVKFPLPNGFFPPVELTPAEIEVYEHRVVIIMKNALAEHNLHEAMGPRPDYGSRWTTVGNVEHLTAIREINPSRNVEASRIFGRVDGDYRNFIDFFYSDSAQQVFAVNQFMFGYAVDAAVLCNIHTKGSKKPHEYLGIKWVCLQPSTLARKRDMCFLEYLVYSKDLQSRDVGVRITLPVLLNECPPLPDKLKTRRLHSHTVTIVRPVDNDTESSEIFMTSEVDMNKGSHISSVTSIKKLMTTLSSMALFADSKRISVHGMRDRSSWTPKKARPNCNVCNRKFTATRRRQHCRLCGDVACRRCTTTRAAPIVTDSTARTFQVSKTVFCKACMGKVRNSGINHVRAADSQDGGVFDAEASLWSEGKSRSQSFDSRYHFAGIDGSSVASLSPANTSFLHSSLPLQETADVEEYGSTPRSQRAFSSSIASEAKSEIKTSVSSSLDEDMEVVVTEPNSRVLIDLRHLRTMAGAERVVQEVEKENLRVMRESLEAQDIKPVRLVVSPSNKDNDLGFGYSSNRSCTLPLMEEVDDEDESDVIEISTESSGIVSSTRQIVSSPLNETFLNDGPLEKNLFRSDGANVSIDQRLFEQEVLLKRLVMAANASAGYRTPSVRAHQ